MNLEKSLRAFISPAYDPIDGVTATDEEAVDLAQLDTDLRPGGEITPLFEEEYWPNSLILRVHFVPVPFREEQHQINSTFSSNEITYLSTPFYDSKHQQGQLRDNCYAGIDLVCKGVGILYQGDIPYFFKDWKAGEFKIKNLQTEPDLIYHKPFPVQHEYALTCMQQHLGAGKWSMTTHLKKQFKVNESPIFSYGGFYQPHLSLDHIVPVYATFSGSNDNETRITLRSQKFWHERGVVEDQSIQLGDTTYTFHDLMKPEEIMSLGAVIKSGLVKIRIENEGEEKIYQSCQYQRPSGGEGVVDITFIAT